MLFKAVQMMLLELFLFLIELFFMQILNNYYIE